jgi:hypothetical protein
VWPKIEYWDREELYAEVWSTPMWKLSKKFGISDVGLAKVCRKLSIPVPGRGYWARKEAGHTVEQIPLPPMKRTVRLRKPPPRKGVPPIEQTASAAEQSQIERILAVDRSGRSLPALTHPLIVKARAALSKAKPDERGILMSRGDCLDVHVSESLVDRALGVMAKFIDLFESEGFKLTVGERTAVTIHGQVLGFGLTEQVRRVEAENPTSGSLVDRIVSYKVKKQVSFAPNGKLTIEIRNMSDPHRSRRSDTKPAALESLVPTIAAEFVRIALTQRAEHERRVAEERERQRKIAEREQLRAAIKLEQQRVRALRQIAASWDRAERLRAFVASAARVAREHGQETDPGTPMGDWLLWAAAQADRLDPLVEGPASVLDRKAEVIEERATWYGYGYQKPEPPFRFPKPLWRIS